MTTYVYSDFDYLDHYVEAILKEENEIKLSDESIWEITFDKEKMESWQKGDKIVLDKESSVELDSSQEWKIGDRIFINPNFYLSDGPYSLVNPDYKYLLYNFLNLFNYHPSDLSTCVYAKQLENVSYL